MSDTPKLLWTPSPERIAQSNLATFRRAVGRNSDDYMALHAWSVDQPEAFWTAVWDFGGTWPAYLVGVVWGGVLIVALLCAPEAEFFASPHEEGTARARFRARDIWPWLSDY